MASIWPDSRTGTYLIKFHYGGRRFTRSCQTDKERQAATVKTLVEETISLLNTGRLVMPDDVSDAGTWIMSGGKLEHKPVLQSRSIASFDHICQKYMEDQRDKAPATVAGETIHIRHLKRLLGEKTQLGSVTTDTLRRYVDSRLKEPTRRTSKNPRRKKSKAPTATAQLVTGATVKKELTTFRQIWDWARMSNIVRTPCPLLDPHKPRKWAVSLPKPAQSDDFMTWAEIEQRIERGGLSEFEKAQLWKWLFLDEKQVAELLDFVRETAHKQPFIHAMFAIAAYAGARRSEICNAKRDDFKFDENIVIIRERKRRKDLESSTRKVPLHPHLKAIMQTWFDVHPGGQYAVVPPVSMPRRKARPALDALTREEAHHHFKQTLKKSKWSVIRGFHVLRHSFGAICTRIGVPMTMTAKWMGHSTQEMMALYQHLHPVDEQQWMARLPFG